MAHWNRPPDLNELQELQLQGRRRTPGDRRWQLAAFLGGALVVVVLGLAAGVFDSGPTDLDVSIAYREGFDRAAAEARSYWAEEFEDQWWQGYAEGRAEGATEATQIAQSVQREFSWGNGYAAGLRSDEISVDGRFREGWRDGYVTGWVAVAGERQLPPRVPDPPRTGSAEPVIWSEGEAGP